MNISAALKTARAQQKAEGLQEICSVLAGPGRSGIIFSNGSERRRLTFNRATGEVEVHVE